MTSSAPSVAEGPGLLDYTLIVLLAAIFGASFMLTKVAVQDIPPATVVLFRLVIASAILYVAMRLRSQSLLQVRGAGRDLILAAVFGNAAPFFLISWGQERVDAGLAAILMATMPLMTLVLAHFLTRDERLNAIRLIGFVLGLLGVAVLIGFDKLATLGDETVRQYAIAGGALCYAINAIVTKRLVGLPRRATATALMIVSALIMLPFSLLLDQPFSLQLGVAGWVSVVALGILPTAIGTLILFEIVKRRGAAFLSQINFLVPVFGVLWAMLFLSETLPANALVALLLILTGVAIARLRFTSPAAKGH